MDEVRHGLEQVFEELPGCAPVTLVDQLGERELARAIDAAEQVELALDRLHLSHIHVQEAHRVAL